MNEPKFVEVIPDMFPIKDNDFYERSTRIMEFVYKKRAEGLEISLNVYPNRLRIGGDETKIVDYSCPLHLLYYSYRARIHLSDGREINIKDRDHERTC